MLTLLSKDNVKINVSKEAVAHSETLSSLVKAVRTVGTTDDYCIPVSHENATSEYLKKVVEYMEHMKETEPEEQDEDSTYLPPPEMNEYQKEFIEMKTINIQVDMLILAQYLKITSLVNILSYKLSTYINGKQPDEIRQLFGIENDLSPSDLKKL